MQRMITAVGLNTFASKVNAALADGWRVVPGTTHTYREYELSVAIEKDEGTAVEADREHWLNGWHRQGTSVLLGTACHCAGCGKFLGLACVAFDGTPLPEKNPDFPFEEATCPLCDLRQAPNPPDAVDKLTERLERLRDKRST